MNKNYNAIKKNDRGFTIVELLVVIVVIGILAAITIVSYTGITTKANNTKANSNAESVQNVAEAFNAEKGYYPDSTADFSAAGLSAKLPSGVYLYFTGGTGNNATPSAANGTTTMLYQYCGAVASPASTAVTGGRIRMWDFSTGALSTTVVYFGTGAASLGVGAGTVCNTWVNPAS